MLPPRMTRVSCWKQCRTGGRRRFCSHADNRFCSHKHIVLAAAERWPKAVRFADPNLQSDPEILAALRKYGSYGEDFYRKAKKAD